MNSAQLLFGVLFGSIGLGYFIYGKKQKTVVPFIVGILLMTYSYFIENTLPLVGVGAFLTVLPYFIRL
ncbi:amino acid transport protein [Acinetobacter rongchengensis]|uniref:Amino acid transport protein n=1 Tax=Acinetobacter rongchengensis TaxID=2419601 RepID=A0A3A8EKZ8_9GAMM|nr:amino acid transport protein [Acinetobacter rongchengensis]RKG35562.1 amino acid transport protein [Acinetobacter rongchengensis]